MDSIKAKKLQAMKNYKNGQFLNKLVLHSLLALLCALFCSYPFWFPHLCSSLNHFVFVSLPNFKSFFFNPKCLFIVGNAIVAFLVTESKLASSCSSPTCDIYDNYVESSSRSILEASTCMEKKEEGKAKMNFTEEYVNKIEKLASSCSSLASDIYNKYVESSSRSILVASTRMEKKEEGKAKMNFTEEVVNKIEKKYMAEKEKGEEKVSGGGGGVVHDNKEEEERDEENEIGLPTEELNKRVENFIARVNRQRWLEARLDDCGRG